MDDYYSYMPEPEESIYNLIPRPPDEVVRPPMYRSKHNPCLPPSYSTFGTIGTSKLQANCNGEDPEVDAAGSKHKCKKNAGTMGAAAVSGQVNPQRFLKRGEGNPALPPVGKFDRATVAVAGAEKRPAVPRRSEKPVMGLMTEKNFVVANAVDNILSAPRRKAPDPPPLGAVAQHSAYGKCPKYLEKTKKKLAEEQLLVGEYQRRQEEDAGGQRMREMTTDEREELVSRLKQKWENTHKQYLAMTFSLDTITKVQRKEALEAELEQLEKAIAKMSKKIIYVYDDKAPAYGGY